MTVTPTSFRLNHQEFADDQQYPDAMIQQYITLALLFLREDRWGDALDYGVEMWVAHNVAVAGDKLGEGADLFGVTGPTTQQHVGEVGFSSNPQFLFQGLEGIGFYARSSYGIQFFQLAKMIGSGGFQQ